MKHLKALVILLPLAASGQAFASCIEFHPGIVECSGNAAADTPGGTMAVTAQNDFAVAMAVDTALDDNTPEPTAAAGPMPGRTGIGLECSWFHDKSSGNTNACTVPLSYTIHNEIDPRRQLTLKLPITRVESENALTPNTTYHVGFGASYTYPLGARWYVTPALNYTYAQGADFVASKPKADLISASITNTYFTRRDGFDIGIGNMFMAAKSVNEQGGQREVHFNILRNGLMFGWPGKAFGRKMFWEASLVDSLIFGDLTYTDHQIELALSLGDKRSYKVTRGGYRLGLSLFDADQTRGGKLSWGYWF
jgi:hypothetical protein